MEKLILNNYVHEGLKGTAVQIIDDDEMRAAIGFSPDDPTKRMWVGCFDNVDGEWVKAENLAENQDYYSEVIKVAYREMMKL